MGKQEKLTGVWLVVLTALALTAFAGNSVLCRLALKGNLIGPGLFTATRMLSGALALVLFVRLRGGGRLAWGQGSWRGAVFLALYMMAFSWAYLGLETGLGALLLFGTVQITMIGWAVIQGERLAVLQGAGLFLALGGMVLLLLSPGGSGAEPSLLAAGLMAVAGVAWGAYTLAGKTAKNALHETAGHFMRAGPVALLLLVWSTRGEVWEPRGLGIALVSGVVTSAAGYTVWYGVVRSLSATRAAALQLLVPVLAALGGLVFGAEVLTIKSTLASVLVLGGVGLVVWKRN